MEGMSGHGGGGKYIPPPRVSFSGGNVQDMQNNVFQMLAQQEIDKPSRELQKMQVQAQQMKLSEIMKEHEYQQRAKTDLAAMPQTTSTTTTLGSMAPQGQPFNPLAGPQQASMDPNAQGNSLASMGLNVNPMQQTEQKPLTIADQFKRQYDYHVQNGRPDLAQGVMDHQIDLSMKAAKVADHMFKTGGKEGLATWLQSNPAFAPLLGDPAQMHITDEGVLYPATDEKGQTVAGMFWHRDESGKPVFKEIKPSTPAAPTKPFTREYDEGDTRITELYDGSGNLTGTKKAPRYKPAAQGGGMVPKGKLSPGYRWDANGNMEAIPGGPAAQKEEDRKKGVADGKAAIDSSITTIDTLLNHPGRKMATGASSYNPTNLVRGTDAYDFNRELESFDSKLFLSNIQFMKGMGALSNAEGAKVSAAAGAIKPGMSEKSFARNLQVIKDTLAKAKGRMDTGVLVRSETPTQKPQPTGKPAPKLSKKAQSIADRY
jgi:hypothetical protein